MISRWRFRLLNFKNSVLARLRKVQKLFLYKIIIFKSVHHLEIYVHCNLAKINMLKDHFREKSHETKSISTCKLWMASKVFKEDKVETSYLKISWIPNC